jgi:hypothetical protein
MRKERQNLISSISWVSEEDVHYEFNEADNSSDCLPESKVQHSKQEIELISDLENVMAVN